MFKKQIIGERFEELDFTSISTTNLPIQIWLCLRFCLIISIGFEQ